MDNPKYSLEGNLSASATGSALDTGAYDNLMGGFKIASPRDYTNTKPDGGSEYLKTDDEKESVATVSMVNPHTRVSVQLAGVIHIASPAFYREIKSRLRGSDFVLYESIGKPRRSTPSDGGYLGSFYELLSRGITSHKKELLKRILDDVVKTGGSDSPRLNRFVDYAQKNSKLLKLTSQGQGFDYSNLPSNWVHADISFMEFNRSMGLLNLIFSPLAVPLAVVIRHPKIIGAISKRISPYGRILPSEGTKSPGFINKTNEPREERVLEVFDSTMRKHPEAREISVFYGAAHLRSLEDKFEDRGFERTGIEFLPFNYLPGAVLEEAKKACSSD